jgi:hypothetical protein
MTFRRFMGFTAMAFLWTGSQIPVYLFGMIQSQSTRVRAITYSLQQVAFLPISMAPLAGQTVGFGL